MSHDAPFAFEPFEASRFLTTVSPVFEFLVTDFGYGQPEVLWDTGVVLGVRYDRSETSVILSYDVRERLFACQIARVMADGAFDDDQNWLRPNEVLAVREGRDRWVTADDFANADADAWLAALEREATNLRTSCADVLRGDWSILPAVQQWHRGVADLPLD